MAMFQKHCHNHLVNEHMAIYNKTVQKSSWSCPHSTEKSCVKTTIDRLHEHALPQITLEIFIKYLIQFIIADGQVSIIFLSLIHILIGFPS